MLSSLKLKYFRLFIKDHRDLAAMWNTIGVSSSARRYIVGIISSRPWAPQL